MTLALLCSPAGITLPEADAAQLRGELERALRAAGASTVVHLPGVPVHPDGVAPAASGGATTTGSATTGSATTAFAAMDFATTGSAATDFAATGSAATASAAAGGRLRELVRQARDAGEQVLVCADNLVAHPSLLWMLATEPAGRSTVLVMADPAGDLKEDRGRIVPAAPGAATTRFLGAMCLAPSDLPLLEKAADRPDLLAALLGDGLVPIATRPRTLRAHLVRTPAELAAARRSVAAVDEDAARLRLAVKEQDDFFTTYAVSSWSPIVTRTAARLGLSPTAVTGLSVLFAGAAALAFWQASRPLMILGGILLYLGFVLDCVDGQLARYTRNFDAFGGWLDTMADRAKEYAVYAGLAAGAERAGLPYAWPLAIAAIVLQTARHMTDTWYGALHDEAAARPGQQATSGVGARLTAASVKAQSQRGSLVYWAKKIVVFPIGERWALMAVLAAFTNGRVALSAVVGFGLLAAAYTLALRSLRALSMRVPVLHTVDTVRHRDDGPLVRSVLSRVGAGLPLPLAALFTAYAAAMVLIFGWGDPSGYPWMLALVAVPVVLCGFPARTRHGGSLDWLVPAALRAAEYLVVVAVGLFGRVPPAVVFLLLFVLALRHYDLTARMEKGAPATGSGRALLGWDGRVLLLVVAALVGFGAEGTAVMAALVGGAFAVTAVRDWRATHAR